VNVRRRQARRQDFAAGGAKPTSGVHIFNALLDVCSNRAEHEMWVFILNEGGDKVVAWRSQVEI